VHKITGISRKLNQPEFGLRDVLKVMKPSSSVNSAHFCLASLMLLRALTRTFMYIIVAAQEDDGKKNKIH
jgi:hypothetical protein